MKQLIKIGDQVFQIPDFSHEFGDRAHHMSMARTCEKDEDGGLIWGTGPSHRRYVVHEFLDNWVFYPISDWMQKWIGDNSLYSFLRTILGFFWGLSCAFPPRDVALYTIWDLRGMDHKRTWEVEDNARVAYDPKKDSVYVRRKRS